MTASQQVRVAEFVAAPADHADEDVRKGQEFNLPTFGGGVSAKELAII